MIEQAGKTVLLAASLSAFIHGQAVYDDTRMRSWAYPLGAIDMSQPNWWTEIWVPGSTVPFGMDKIVGTETLIYSDPASTTCPSCQTEVFNILRPGGRNYWHPNEKKRLKIGYWSEFFRFDPGSGSTELLISMENFSGSETQTPFFAHNFPYAGSRKFSGINHSRGVLKVDYICPGTCPPSTVNAYWVKLGPWNMFNKPILRIARPSGLAERNIVDMNAAIYSDPFQGAILVDEFEHVGADNGTSYGALPSSRRRGGWLWYGKGCGGSQSLARMCRESQNVVEDGSTSMFRLYGGHGGPQAAQHQEDFRGSSFRGGAYSWNGGSDPVVEIPYRDGTANRGWLKVEYTGAAVTHGPYAMKAKALEIGAWDMANQTTRTVSLSAFGVAPSRITGIATTIQSDAKTCGPQCRPGSTISNFSHLMRHSGQGSGGTNIGGGGYTYFDGNSIRLVQVKDQDDMGAYKNYYSTNHSSMARNRGWVRLDYLAGSCEQGPAGFKIVAVPGDNAGACTGTNQPFLIEGAGRGFQSAALTDSFTFVSKPSSAFAATLSVRLEARDANTASQALAGISFRNTLDPKSQHFSVLVSKIATNGLQLWSRTCLNCANQAPLTINAPAGAFWLRIQKGDAGFSAFYHTSSSTTMPNSGWSPLFAPKNIAFTAPYHVGLVVSNSSSPNLSKTTFRNLAFTAP